MKVETHFMRFEGTLKPIKFQLDSISKMMDNIAKELEIEDWTITDVDNFLKGNPHTKY